MKAPMIKSPPTMAAPVKGELSGGGSNWSTMATMKMVRSAATEESTGLVSEMRTRKEPEKAGNRSVQISKTKQKNSKRDIQDVLAFANTLMAIIHACSPRGSSNVSQPM